MTSIYQGILSTIAALLSIIGLQLSHQTPVATTTAALTASSTGATYTDTSGTGTATNGQIQFNGKTIVGADTKTFKLLAGPNNVQTDYAKDKNNVYLGASVVQGADPSTFTVLTGPQKDTKDNVQYYYAKDSAHVYINDLVIAGADPATFTAVSAVGASTSDAHDKNHSYLFGSVVR